MRFTVFTLSALLAWPMILGAASTSPVVRETPGVRQIGSRLELFVDDWLIDRMDGVSLLLHQPIPREVVYRFDSPWEGPWSAYVTIIPDADRYRMYYRGNSKDSPDATCYAESRDGIVWTRPTLGLFEYQGSKANNIVWTGLGAHNFTPFKDTNPACPPKARYKATGWGHREPGRPLFAFQSADGIHWSRLGRKPILTVGEGFDSQNVVFWDTVRKVYVAYFRSAREGKRDIMTATSTDFLSWSDAVFLDYGDTPLEHLYTSAITPYFRAPHIYLGFPKRFVPDRQVVTEQSEKGVSDALFMSSRDGLHWDRRFREAFIRPGLLRLNWMHRSNMVALGIVQAAPDEISIYSSECYDTPENRLRRYTFRPDGFVSVHAPAIGGQMITRPMRFQGDQLAINCSTSAAGTMQVEVQNADGTPVPGFALDDCLPIYGDDIARKVRWKGGARLGRLQNRAIRLRFAMNDADLYALWFFHQAPN